MDVFLIKDGIVENVASYESMEQASKLAPDYTLVERTPENEHINIGEPAP